MKVFHEERTSKNVITPPHPPTHPPETPPRPTPSVWTPMSRLNEDVPWRNALARTLSHTPPKPPQPTPSVWTPTSRQWRCSMRNALARTLSHPPHPSTLGLYFWLLKRSLFGCWLGAFLVADAGRSWLLTRTFLVADSDVLGCWLGQLLTRLL